MKGLKQGAHKKVAEEELVAALPADGSGVLAVDGLPVEALPPSDLAPVAALPSDGAIGLVPLAEPVYDLASWLITAK